MRVTVCDTSKLDSAGRYYNDGFLLSKIEHQDRLVCVLNELLLSKELKDGYYWERTGSASALRPHVYDYDTSILDFLFDNNLHIKIQDLSQRKLILSHIQITKTYPGPSYQDWHRDTYQHEPNPWVGNTPPAHKIIFYPKNNTVEPRLKFIRGSNRCTLNNLDFDLQLIKNFETEFVMTSNDEVLIFDTSMLHGVIPDQLPEGSIRLIYNFISEQQYIEKYSLKTQHKNLYDLYTKRLNK